MPANSRWDLIRGLKGYSISDTVDLPATNAGNPNTCFKLLCEVEMGNRNSVRVSLKGSRGNRNKHLSKFLRKRQQFVKAKLRKSLPDTAPNLKRFLGKDTRIDSRVILKIYIFFLK